MVNQLTTIEKDLIVSLEQAIKSTEEARKAAQAEAEQRVSVLRTTIETLRGTHTNGNGSTPTTKPATRAKEGKVETSRLSISEDRLGKVIAYLDKHPRVRQSELVDRLSFNSGTVSVALRVLAEQGKVQKIETEKGSNEWIKADAPAKKGRGRPKKVTA